MSVELYSSEPGAKIISVQEFMDFLYQFKKPIICPVCGTSGWDAQGVMDGEAVKGEPLHKIIESINYSRFKPEEDMAVSYPVGLPVFRLTCNTCAYMMLFSYKRVRTLINQKKNTNEQNEEKK